MTMRLIRESGVVRINKSFPLLLLALLLTSCAARPLLKDLNDIEAVPAKEALVFGRVKVFDEGQPLDLGFHFWGGYVPFDIHIISDAGPEPTPYTYTPSGDGSFYWDLAAGGYTITSFWGVFRWGEVTRRGIFARFVIPEETPLVYIGTLTIRKEEDHFTMGIEDEYDQALQWFKQRFPEVKGSVAKRLMQLEPR